VALSVESTDDAAMSQPEPNSQTYVWAVQQGMVEVWRENGRVRLRSSHDRPGDAPICILTDDDALEIATLLYHLAKRTPGSGLGLTWLRRRQIDIRMTRRYTTWARLGRTTGGTENGHGLIWAICDEIILNRRRPLCPGGLRCRVVFCRRARKGERAARRGK